jgi:hypothetical protein
MEFTGFSVLFSVSFLIKFLISFHSGHDFTGSTSPFPQQGEGSGMGALTLKEMEFTGFSVLFSVSFLIKFLISFHSGHDFTGSTSPFPQQGEGSGMGALIWEGPGMGVLIWKGLGMVAETRKE